MVTERQRTLVDYIKDNYSQYIDMSDEMTKNYDGNYDFYIFATKNTNSMPIDFNSYCYAALFRRIREAVAVSEMIYLLHFDRSNNLFDYNPIFDELNTIFSGYFNLTRFYSGRKRCRAIYIDINGNKLTTMRWKGLYMLCSIIRTMDKQSISEWHKRYNGDSIDNVHDLLYHYHMDKICYGTAYEFNDSMRNRGLERREDDLHNHIDKVLATFDYIFGKNSPRLSYDNPNVRKLSRHPGWHQQAITRNLFRIREAEE